MDKYVGWYVGHTWMNAWISTRGVTWMNTYVS